MKKQAQLANDLKKLQYQLSYSEHINRELSEQLSILQQKTGISNQKQRFSDKIPEIDFNKMLQELYYIEPLLMAYQHKISLFEQELNAMKEESSNLQKYSEEIVKQNDFLRKQLHRKGEYILKSQQIGININFVKLDNESLHSKNKLLVEKNEYLTQKIKDLSKTIENQKNGQTNELLLTRLQKNIQKQSELRKQQELQTVDIKAKLEILTNQFNNEKAINKQYERKISQMENQISKHKNEVKIIRQQFQASILNHDHIKQSLQNELETTKTLLLSAQKRQSQMFNKSMLLQSQLNQKNSKIHNYTLQNTQLQANNNNMLQMLQNYQSKVGALNKKIKSYQNQIKDSSQSFTENRKQLEIALWKLTQKNKQIQRKETEFKKQKQRLQKMWQDRLELMRTTFEQEKDRIYDQLKTKNPIQA